MIANESIKAIYYSEPEVGTVHTRGVKVYANLPRGPKRVCLYINGKRCIITDAHITTYTALIIMLARWERIFKLDGLCIAAHISYDDITRTFLRTGYGKYYES